MLCSKISTTENAIKMTRKGLKNTISRFLKAPERSEDAGLKSDFMMNKSELELRQLVDLSFAVQDYETVCQNAEFPINDFRKI